MNLRHLRSLVAIAESESFLAAAERLFVTPAAVSMQMKTLEAELQVALFDRTTRPPRLNAQGLALIDKARDVLDSAEAFREAAGALGELSGRLVIGSISGVTSDLLPQALANLRRRHPRLVIRLEEGQSAPLSQRVLRRELDAAIVTQGPLPEPALASLPILSEPMVVVTAQAAPDEDWRAVIASQPFLRINRQSGMGILIDHTIRAAGLAPEDAMELDSSETILQMAAAGLGAGVVPLGRETQAHQAHLAVLPFGDPPVERRVVLIQRAKSQRDHLAAVLVEELQALVAAST
ncbi:MAG: LysR substrate-binding domain-containing protein [Pseudomonadota bacterium]